MYPVSLCLLYSHLQAFSSGVYLLRLYNQGLPDRVLFHARKVQTKFRCVVKYYLCGILSDPLLLQKSQSNSC